VASKAPPSHVPAELHAEFEAHTRALLRTRFLWFSGILTGLGVFLLVLWIIVEFAGPGLLYLLANVTPDSAKQREWWPMVLITIVSLLAIATYATCFFIAKKKPMPQERFLQLTYLLVVCDGLLHVVPNSLPRGETAGLGIWGFAFTHFLACCFLPWTIRQALQPLLLVFGVWALLKLAVGEGGFGMRFTQIAWAPLLFLPALGVVWMMHARRAQTFERQFLYRRYRDVRRELYDARRIHEALFPQPITTGPVRVRYKYEPMQQIGGDYFFAFQSSHGTGGALSVVLLDVTGHGILAALTVNRIYGELSRIFAERPGVSPAEVLRTLNRYANLTLAPHSVYVTAMCARVDPASNTLLYANGGHPPAYLRRTDGSVEELVATTFLLGPCPDTEYDPGCLEVAMHPGDSLIAYTDGVIEARGHAGKQWGLAGIRHAVRDRIDCGSWANSLIKQVEDHRIGPAEDDTLVVEVWRPLRATDESGKSGIFRATEAAKRARSGTGVFTAVGN
jgi:serine phosphatase RsbU (regulator of sigma subunit)